MRSHTNCADWGYDNHPNRADVTERCNRITKIAARRPGFFAQFGFDTRPGHACLFQGMTPANCSCILGTYRGTASCPSVSNFSVTTLHDTRVGVPPIMVEFTMNQLLARCDSLVKVHNEWVASTGFRQPPQNALIRFVSLLAFVLQQFLTIHPYMDGNGHTARLLIYVMMCRAGYIPSGWDIDAKQPYADALSLHRSGKPGALEIFLVNVIGQAPPPHVLPTSPV